MNGFETSNKSLPSTKRKIPFREDFDIETINPCVSRSGHGLFGDNNDDSLEETATIYIRKTSLGESAGSSGIWGPRKSHIKLSHALGCFPRAIWCALLVGLRIIRGSLVYRMWWAGF